MMHACCLGPTACKLPSRSPTSHTTGLMQLCKPHACKASPGATTSVRCCCRTWVAVVYGVASIQSSAFGSIASCTTPATHDRRFLYGSPLSLTCSSCWIHTWQVMLYLSANASQTRHASLLLGVPGKATCFHTMAAMKTTEPETAFAQGALLTARWRAGGV